MEAVVGLVGVVVGALCTALASLALDRRREQRERKGIAQVVAIELLDAARRMEAIKHEPQKAVAVPLVPSWEALRTPLATHIDLKAWLAVQSAINAAERIATAINELDADYPSVAQTERAGRQLEEAAIRLVPSMAS